MLTKPLSKPTKILVVCLGNTCRSPAGEYLLRYYAKQSNNEFLNESQFTSAGLYPTTGGMAHYTAEYIELKGMVTHHFKNSPIQFDPIAKYDWILVMEQYMKDDILDLYYRKMQFVEPEKFKQANEKIQLFSEMAGGSGDVEDPYGDDRDRYFRILQQIENYAKKIILSLNLSSVKE
jgi:protein-tyrosine phosphatase